MTFRRTSRLNRKRKRRGSAIPELRDIRPTTELLEDRCLLAAQVIQTLPEALTVDAESSAVFDVEYSTEKPEDATTTGLTLRMHYNSMELTPDISAITASAFSGAIIQDTSEPVGGAQDLPDTDRYVNFLWVDINGEFPSKPLPLTLFTATFMTTDLFDGESVQFTADPPVGFDFISTPAVLTPPVRLDYGDAPDGSGGTGPGNYSTQDKENGPRHVVVNGLFLGASVDGIGEGDLHNDQANADDQFLAGGTDDEDGVLDPLDLLGTEGSAPTVTLLATNTTGSDATLYGWIDFNQSGAFANSNPVERTSIVVPAGTIDGRFTLTFPVLPTGSAGTTYARFRLSTDADAANSTGPADDGEVEDYVFTITAPSSGTVDDFVKIASDTSGGPTLADGDRFGSSVANIGDLNGDGVDDLAVGAILDDTGGDNRGAVHLLFMNADGTVASSTKIGDLTGGGPNLGGGDGFGSAVAAVGDLDGDGVTELAVGASGENLDGSDRGAVYILFLNTDGTAKSFTLIANNRGGGPGLTNFDRFGTSVASIGDFDGDGIIDLAVGARGDDEGGNNRGAVYVLLLNADGTVKSHQKIADDVGGLVADTLEDSDFFGFSVTSVGDLNGDGVPDLAVGASADENDSAGDSGEGAVYVLLMNADGTVLSQQKITDGNPGGLIDGTLDGGDSFGFSVTSVGDLDGDGVPDLAVGAPNGENNSTNEGEVYVLLLNADGTVKRQQKISDGNPGGLTNGTLSSSDDFGTSVSAIGDLNNDGIIDLAVGAKDNNTGGTDRGALYVLFLAPPDTTSPTVNVALDDSSLKIGETATVTFTFDETSVGFAADDVTAQNGALTAFTATGDPLVFTATFTPTASIEDSTNVISVGTGYTDAAGNAGTAGVSANYTIDTLAPTVTITPNGTVTSDSPIVFTFQFSEAVSGFVAGDVSLTNGSAGTFTPVDGDTFTQEVTPTSTGAVTVNVAAAVAQDAAGNSNVSGSASVTSPAAGEVALPGGGTYEVLLDGGDLVARITGGAEQFRRVIASVTVLEITGSAGDDQLTVLNSGGAISTPILFNGKGGADQFDGTLATGPATLLGGAGNDTLTGGPGNDLIFAGSGSDTVNGGNGDDLIFPGPGSDTVAGGDGNDFIQGGAGKDSLVGNAGNDTVLGGGGHDTINGGDGTDRIIGGGGKDSLSGGDDADLIVGGSGQDVLDGDAGDDILIGGSGPDDLAGGLGNDTLNGIFRDDAFNQQVGPDLEIGGQRPAPRPAPVSATSKSEESAVLPTFKAPQVDNEDIDELFEGSLLPELLEL
ncbi:MAG: Ca2+-binding RTX toxin-like protein [Planctomycetaceae bacterium]|jgi:Ca2+-binding RTX toxin-like protein